MKKFIIRNSVKIGLLLFAAYQLVSHIVPISNAIAIPFCLIGIVFMMIGLFNSESCICKRRSNH